jgi:drug/metabolite transporter (DMT)-like permease
MWRIVFLGALGIMLGSRARSERWTVLMALLFGLVYGAAEVLTVTAVTGPLPLWRTLFLLGLGLVMAAPVYAIGEIWRRTRIRAMDWLRRWRRQ